MQKCAISRILSWGTLFAVFRKMLLVISRGEDDYICPQKITEHSKIDIAVLCYLFLDGYGFLQSVIPKR